MYQDGHNGEVYVVHYTDIEQVYDGANEDVYDEDMQRCLQHMNEAYRQANNEK